MQSLVSVNRSESFSREALEQEFLRARSVYDEPWRHTEIRNTNNVTASEVAFVIKEFTSEVATGELRVDRCRNLSMEDVIEWGLRHGFVPADVHEFFAACRNPELIKQFGPYAIVAPGSFNRCHRGYDGYPCAMVDAEGLALAHYPIQHGIDLQQRTRVLFVIKNVEDTHPAPEVQNAGEGMQEFDFDVDSAVHDRRARVNALHASLKGLKPRRGRRRACLKSFPLWVTNRQVLAWARRNGYRPAFPLERETLFETLPTLMSGTWIVDLGTVERKGGHRFSPVVVEEKQGVVLWSHVPLLWHPGTRFLFIKNS